MPYIGTSPSQGVRRVHTYTATANQTTFTGAGAEGATLSYKDSNFVDVYQNGVKLGDADYTATSGTSIVLGTGATVSDLVVIVAYDVFSAADTVSKADGGQFDGAVTFAANIDATAAGVITSVNGFVCNGGGTFGGPFNTINGNGILRFRDDAIQLQSSTDGQLDIDADTEIEITTTTVDLNGALTISGDTTLEDGADLITASAGTSNFRAGVNAGNSIASNGNYNVVIGDEAGTALTTGDGNVAVGFEALKTEDGHGLNTAVGYQALKTLNAGADSYNTAIGYQAGLSITTGLYNTIVGGIAGDGITSGTHNTAIGMGALNDDTQGNKSTAVGQSALTTQNFTSSTDTHNTAVGYNAGGAVTVGQFNTLIGSEAGDALTSGGYNVAVGVRALSSENGHGNNIAIGYEALRDLDAGADGNNVAIGQIAGRTLTTGIRNTIVGAFSGDELTDADHNATLGFGALGSNTKGNKSIAIGSDALTAQNFTTSTDVFNVAIGHESGASVTTGVENTIVGGLAGDAMTDADRNTAVGYLALTTNTKSDRNTAIGRSALENLNHTSVTGGLNTAIGHGAGASLTTGTKNTIIGSYGGNSNSLDIRTESNHIVLSDGDGTPKFRVTGGSNDNQVFAPGVYTWTTSNAANVIVTSSTGHLARSTSALKYKKDIRDLEEIDVDKFRPVRFKSKSDLDDQTKDNIGIIADEVHDAGITELVTYGDDNEVEGFQYERLTVVLLKAMQEQKKTISALEARIKTLEG